MTALRYAVWFAIGVAVGCNPAWAKDCNGPGDDRLACTCEAEGYVYHCPAIPAEASSWSNCSKTYGGKPGPRNFYMLGGVTTWVSCTKGEKVRPPAPPPVVKPGDRPPPDEEIPVIIIRTVSWRYAI